jgi:hypothetical protein
MAHTTTFVAVGKIPLGLIIMGAPSNLDMGATPTRSAPKLYAQSFTFAVKFLFIFSSPKSELCKQYNTEIILKKQIFSPKRWTFLSKYIIIHNNYRKS